MDAEDDIMEIDPASEDWQNQPECIDMTSDEEPPVVINIQAEDTATGLLKNLLKPQNLSPDDSTSSNVEHSISKLNQISFSSVSSDDKQSSTRNEQNSEAVSTACIEIDDDITICDPPISSSLGSRPDSAPTASNGSGESNETSSSHSQQTVPKNASKQKMLDELIESCVEEPNVQPASKPGRSVANNLDDDCEMVILTDDEDKERTPPKRKLTSADEKSQNSNEGTEVPLPSNVTAPGSKTEASSRKSSENRDCEMVILTDDEDKDDSPNGKSVDSSSQSVCKKVSDVPSVEGRSLGGAPVKTLGDPVSNKETVASGAETGSGVTNGEIAAASRKIDDSNNLTEMTEPKEKSSNSDAIQKTVDIDLTVDEVPEPGGKTQDSPETEGAFVNLGNMIRSASNGIKKSGGFNLSVQDASKKLLVKIDLTNEETPKAKEAGKEARDQAAEGTIIGKAINPNLKDDNLFKAPKPPVSVEVIDIEAMHERKRASYECVNPNCKSGIGLQEAEDFVIAYFNVKAKEGLKCCEECAETAMSYADGLLYNLVMGKSIFDVPYNADSLVVSLDLDSDDEAETRFTNLIPKRKKLQKASENYLNTSIHKVLDKYGFEYQMDECGKKFEAEIDRMKAEFDSIRLEIDFEKKRSAEMYEQIHGPYRPKFIEQEELQIFDCQIKPHGCQVPLNLDRDEPWTFRPNLQAQPLAPQRSLTQRSQSFKPAAKQATTVTPPPPRMAVATKKVNPYNKSNAHDPRKPARVPVSDIVQVIPSKVSPPPNLPNHGPLIRTPVKTSDIVYFMKASLYGIWIPGKVMKVSGVDPKTAQGSFKFLYKIRPEPVKKYQDPYKSVVGKHIAYYEPASVRLPVGTRVIAHFKEENEKAKSDKFYAGVIAEPPKTINKFRYLVFFDDGYAQYANHEEIRVVCESSQNVWEDVLPDFKDFIQQYLFEYPERPMVKLQKKQVVKTEWNGKWWIAKVLEIDSSLVKMWFDADRRVEWIYRGSKRLGPLWAAHKRQETGDRLPRGNHRSRHLPYVEYTRQESDGGSKGMMTGSVAETSEGVEKRAVARKSGSGKPALQRSDSDKKDEPTIPDTHFVPVRVPSKMEVVDVSSGPRPRQFRPHQCANSCVSWIIYQPNSVRGHGPLVIPLLHGYERVLNRVKNKSIIFYVAPCGRRIRNISEIHRYLRITKSHFTVDQFSFEEWVNCLNEFKITKYFTAIPDVSYGKEKQPINCVNYLDRTMPNYVHYITEREPRDGVHLNLDPDFLVCCDCTDDCQDKAKCACWQLTISSQKLIPGVKDSELNEGYIYRRLPERILTGIYECNSRCRCSKVSCLNRVVQQPLMQKLQLFKTEKKGWGIRCLNDIPIGSFICIYAGHLLTESSANEEGKNYGDEYLAELDYIESIERIKEDYEENVPEELLSEAEKSEESSEDSEEEKGRCRPSSPRSRKMDAEFELRGTGNEQSEFKMMLRKKPEKPKKKKDDKSSSDGEKSSNKEDDGDSDGDDRKRERAPLRFNPTLEEDPGEDQNGEKSLRNLFGEDECVYIMDAKCNGNIGRYLNHSCEPNVFVQNVFVDTHDLRFPWVAFFALNYIPAGQELTWDYNYDVNSVQGKVLLCYCNSPECRGRLL